MAVEVTKREEAIVNQDGELLQIVINFEDELPEGETLVPLAGYYDVLNVERYEKSVWNFTENKWVGAGEVVPEVPVLPSETEVLKAELTQTKAELIQTQEAILEIYTMIVGGV